MVTKQIIGEVNRPVNNVSWKYHLANMVAKVMHIYQMYQITNMNLSKHGTQTYTFVDVKCANNANS